MPTWSELRERGVIVQRVIAERLGLDPGDVVRDSIIVTVDGTGDTVRWEGLRKMESGFLADVLAEADRRYADG